MVLQVSTLHAEGVVRTGYLPWFLPQSGRGFVRPRYVGTKSELLLHSAVFGRDQWSPLSLVALTSVRLQHRSAELAQTPVQVCAFLLVAARSPSRSSTRSDSVRLRESA